MTFTPAPRAFYANQSSSAVVVYLCRNINNPLLLYDYTYRVRAALIEVLLFHVERRFIIALHLIESHVLLRLTFST